MIEPQSDEERKALRLAKVMYDAECIDEHDIRLFLQILAEARAIFREEQDAKAENPRSATKENELRAVRDEIRLRSEVLRAYPDLRAGESLSPEELKQWERFRWLLRRERELMGEEWATNG